MFILPKMIYRLNAIPIKIPITFFHRNSKAIQKFVRSHKRLKIAKTIFSKNKDGDIILS